MPDPKLCIYCQHAKHIGQSAECWHPNNVGISPVHGRPIARLECSYLRNVPELCGIGAVWYVPREVKAAS